MECLKYATYVFCNEDEANAYGELFGIEKDNYNAVAEHIANSESKIEGLKRHAIVTVGAKPIRWAHNGEVKEIEIPPVPKE